MEPSEEKKIPKSRVRLKFDAQTGVTKLFLGESDENFIDTFYSVTDLEIKISGSAPPKIVITGLILDDFDADFDEAEVKVHYIKPRSLD